MTSQPETWQALLPGAFAGMTAPFGVHSNDHERAVGMFHLALRQGATLADILVEAERYLHGEGCGKQRIERELVRIRNFSSRPHAKPRSSRSWLVTLETFDGATEIVSLFKVQRSANFVRQYMEQYYISRFYTVHEKLLYSASRKNNPYPARFEEINGIPWLGRITCGHNPFLYARLVKNLRVETSSGADVLKWEEQEIPQRVLNAHSSLP